MKTQTTKVQAQASTQNLSEARTPASHAHLDRIPDKVLTHGLYVGLVVVAFAWLVIVGSSWAQN